MNTYQYVIYCALSVGREVDKEVRGAGDCHLCSLRFRRWLTSTNLSLHAHYWSQELVSMHPPSETLMLCIVRNITHMYLFKEVFFQEQFASCCLSVQVYRLNHSTLSSDISLSLSTSLPCGKNKVTTLSLLLIHNLLYTSSHPPFTRWWA